MATPQMDDGNHRYGGPWSEWKVQAVSDYLDAYLNITDNRGFTRWYIDAFAGSGTRLASGSAIEGQALIEGASEEVKLLHKGSALRALEKRFERFLLVDNDKAKVDGLRAHAQDAGKEHLATIIEGDACDTIVKWCSNLAPQSMDRAVVFVDPYGTNAEWRMIEALAKTGRADVFILVPTRLLTQFMTKRYEDVHPNHVERLDSFFGNRSWSTELYKPQPIQQNIFFTPEEEMSRTASAQGIIDHYKNRLRSIFRGGVSENVRWLCNSAGGSMFGLVFAVANASEKACVKAIRVADHILGKPPG